MNNFSDENYSINAGTLSLSHETLLGVTIDVSIGVYTNNCYFLTIL